MCGRFALISDTEQLIAEFGISPASVVAMPDAIPRYNVAPTQPVAAIRLADGTKQRELTFFHWGLIPSWVKDPKIGSRMINAMYGGKIMTNHMCSPIGRYSFLD